MLILSIGSWLSLIIFKKNFCYLFYKLRYTIDDNVISTIKNNKPYIVYYPSKIVFKQLFESRII